MGLSPRFDALAVFRPAEVTLILRLLEPATLRFGFTLLAAGGLRAVALVMARLSAEAGTVLFCVKMQSGASHELPLAVGSDGSPGAKVAVTDACLGSNPRSRSLLASMLSTFILCA